MNANLRNITNNFQDVRLLSLASWREADAFIPHDTGGPYVVIQEGYHPADPNMQPDEFILGRAGKWLSLGYFFRLSIPERRTEFVFAKAAEIMRLMQDLPAKVSMYDEPEGTAPENDEMAEALQASKQHSAV
jgi:hypothetical protein